MFAYTGEMLSPYRVIDLSNERGLLCGQIFADLGADVVRRQAARKGGKKLRSGPTRRGEAGQHALDRGDLCVVLERLGDHRATLGAELV